MSILHYLSEFVQSKACVQQSHISKTDSTELVVTSHRKKDMTSYETAFRKTGLCFDMAKWIMHKKMIYYRNVCNPQTVLLPWLYYSVLAERLGKKREGMTWWVWIPIETSITDVCYYWCEKLREQFFICSLMDTSQWRSSLSHKYQSQTCKVYV